jgi:hypothetical protein
LFTDTTIAPASPTRSETLRSAEMSTLSPAASVRPLSARPSIVVRIQTSRTASATTDRFAVRGTIDFSPADLGLEGSPATDAGVASFVAEAGTTAASLLEFPLASHQIVIPATVATMPTDSATRAGRRLSFRTGTESLGKGDDRSTLDADSLSPGRSPRSGPGDVIEISGISIGGSAAGDGTTRGGGSVIASIGDAADGAAT